MQCNIYRIMLEPEAFLQSSGRRRLKSEFIIRLNAPFHCFRTSRSLLWPLKSKSRLLFVIMTPFLSQWPALSSLKIITCLKKWKDALIRFMSRVISRQISHTDYSSQQRLIYKLQENKQIWSNIFIYNYNNNSSISIPLERLKLPPTFTCQPKINSCTFIII